MATRRMERAAPQQIFTPDGTVLVVPHVSAQGPRAGTALITNTQAQHVGNLARTIHGLAAQGWDVVAADLRGYGASVGRTALLAHKESGKG